MHPVNTRTKSIYSRLAIETKHTENKDEEITGIKLSTDTDSTMRDIPYVCQYNKQKAI